MRRPILSISALCLAVALTGCESVSNSDLFSNNCKIGGTLAGAVAGGLAGSFLGKGSGNILAIVAGTAAGAYLGNRIGGMLDCDDQKAAAAATQAAGDAPTGSRITWASQPVSSAEVQKKAAPSAAPAPPLKKKTAASAKSGSGWAVQEPPAGSAPASQWAAAEPIRSEGGSGMWGWSEPVSAPAQTADGRTCRQMRQGVVDAQGKQTVETVSACKDDQSRWVVAEK